MTHLSTAPQHRRFSALDTLDKLVARECEAIKGAARPAARAADPAEAPPDPAEAGDDAFVQGAIAYLSTHPDAAGLIARIDRGWREPQPVSDEPPPSADAADVPDAGPADAAAQAGRESAP
jgi:hypothetical protein